MIAFRHLLLCFLAAPFIISYCLLICFFFINGVTGADGWVKNLWGRFGGWKNLCALFSGVMMWIIAFIALNRGE